MILTVRPGITGPAAIAYRHEEQLLAAADDPERYNREVIWPDKVRINREYVENYSLVLRPSMSGCHVGEHLLLR